MLPLIEAFVVVRDQFVQLKLISDPLGFSPLFTSEKSNIPYPPFCWRTCWSICIFYKLRYYYTSVCLRSYYHEQLLWGISIMIIHKMFRFNWKQLINMLLDCVSFQNNHNIVHFSLCHNLRQENLNSDKVSN